MRTRRNISATIKKQTAHAMLQKLLVEGEAEIEYLRHRSV